MFYRETGLTVEQINSLLAEISGSSVIKSLDLIDKNLFQASVDLMVAAFTALESLTLHYGTLIGGANINTLLTALGSSGSSNLTELSLRNISLSHIEPGVMGRSVRNLRSLEIMISDLVPSQLEAMFTTFVRREAGVKLKQLCLSHNDLSQLSHELFVDVCKNVQVLEIFCAKVTTAQMEALFKALSSSKCCLRELNCNYNDLSEVDPESLALGVNSLHKAYLYKTELSELQVEAILQQGTRQSRLYSLDLRYNSNNHPSSHLPKYLNSRIYKIEM